MNLGLVVGLGFVALLLMPLALRWRDKRCLKTALEKRLKEGERGYLYARNRRRVPL